MIREEELIDKIKRGSISAFETLIKRYKVQIYKLILRIVKDPKEAEDLTQEVFLKIYENIAKFKGNSSFYTWIYRISLNVALTYLRGQKRKLEFIDDMIYPSRLTNVDEDIENKELIETIFKAAEGLPKKEKLVFILKFQAEFSNREISEILRISKDSVKSNLYHALKRIRTYLKKEGFLGD